MSSEKRVRQRVRPGKPFWSRAFSHKVRTGCRTWIRRKKCDEGKPTCHRCQTDKFVCDGYTHVLSQPARHIDPITSIGPSLSPTQFSASGAQFFHHFLTCTSTDLAETPGDSIFWTRYALPLAHSDDAVGKSMAAVGAAHRIFITHELGQSTPLNRAALWLYNDAIASITSSVCLRPESLIVCCLLFICYESMTGRYAESIRHLKAGLKLLATTDVRAAIRDCEFARELLTVFARLSYEVSLFMEDQPLPLEDSFNWAVFNYDQAHQFRDLIEAEHAMRQLAIGSVGDINVLFHLGTTQADHSHSKELVLSAMTSRFRRWIARFEPLVTALTLSTLQAEQYTHLTYLRLQQSQWFIMLGMHSQDQKYVDEACAASLNWAKTIAQSLMTRQRRTFSLDGVLVSGISLILSATSNADIQRHACLLLQSLGKREGLWDSREILELHQATLSQHDPRSWYMLPVSGGIPAYMRSLSLFSDIITPGNSLLKVFLNDSVGA